MTTRATPSDRAVRATASPPRGAGPRRTSARHTASRTASALSGAALSGVALSGALCACTWTADLDSLTSGARTESPAPSELDGGARGSSNVRETAAPTNGDSTDDVTSFETETTSPLVPSPTSQGEGSSQDPIPPSESQATDAGETLADPDGTRDRAASSQPDATMSHHSTAGDAASTSEHDAVRDAGCSAACDCAPCDEAVLLHRYSFTDAAATVADSVGNAAGSLQGDGEHVEGRLQLDGAGYVSLPTTVLTGLTSVSFEMWFVPLETRPWERLFDFGENSNGSGRSYLFLTVRTPSADSALQVGFRPRGGSERALRTTRQATDGELTHVVVIFDGGDEQMRLYANGELAGSAAAGAALADITVRQFWLGRSLFSGDPYFRGQLDEFRVYAGVLSGARVADHFAAGPNDPSP